MRKRSFLEFWAAIRMHCPKYEVLYEQLKRVSEHDMDFANYVKFRPLTRKLFVDIVYHHQWMAALIRKLSLPNGGNRNLRSYLRRSARTKNSTGNISRITKKVYLRRRSDRLN